MTVTAMMVNGGSNAGKNGNGDGNNSDEGDDSDVNNQGLQRRQWRQ